MTKTGFLEQVSALSREGKVFAVATVVARHAPVSAHLGDRALVFADGRIEGFVGGACSREIIRKQGLEAIRAGCGRLVSIRPDAGASSESSADHVFVPMTCVSEGAVDVYVQPYPLPRRILIVGATPVADALARLGRSMEYDVTHVVDSSEIHDVEQTAAAPGVSVVALGDFETFLSQATAAGANLAAVVASQGNYDERALELLLRRGIPYIGLLASPKRGAAVRALLKNGGVPGVDTIRIPAGIDLGARTPPEVALSILAQIVMEHPSGVPEEAAEPPAGIAAPPGEASATDPVCGMQVEIASARHMAKVDDVAYYFCCAGCREQFIANPARYRTASA